MRKTYTVVLTPTSSGGWMVQVPALPGCLTEGPTLTEALLMAEDAASGYLEVLAEDGEPILGAIHVPPVDCLYVAARGLDIERHATIEVVVQRRSAGS